MPKYQIKKIEDFQLLKDRVYEAIKKEITGLNLRPGEQLSEKSLAHELGVSKSPVRDALQRLESEGFVYASPYRGYFVSTLSATEFEDIFQMRIAIELFCLREKIDSYSETDINDLEAVTKMSVEQIKKSDEASALENHLCFHKMIVNKLGNKLIDDVYFNLCEKMVRYLYVAKKNLPDIIIESDEEHQELFKAIQTRNSALSVRILKAHLSSLMNKYLKSEKIIKYHNSIMNSDHK
ncbi:MAG: GntR family transcriptional regulator [Thermodesulfobacteriota bacterium]|nr:GntR family transcriptional regulator [Thermodesulfobacteriota bacterium]